MVIYAILVICVIFIYIAYLEWCVDCLEKKLHDLERNYNHNMEIVDNFRANSNALWQELEDTRQRLEMEDRMKGF